jgi:hypothetical protein
MEKREHLYKIGHFKGGKTICPTTYQTFVDIPFLQIDATLSQLLLISQLLRCWSDGTHNIFEQIHKVNIPPTTRSNLAAEGDDTSNQTSAPPSPMQSKH